MVRKWGPWAVAVVWFYLFLSPYMMGLGNWSTDIWPLADHTSTVMWVLKEGYTELWSATVERALAAGVTPPTTAGLAKLEIYPSFSAMVEIDEALSNSAAHYIDLQAVGTNVETYLATTNAEGAYPRSIPVYTFTGLWAQAGNTNVLGDDYGWPQRYGLDARRRALNRMRWTEGGAWVASTGTLIWSQQTSTVSECYSEGIVSNGFASTNDVQAKIESGGQGADGVAWCLQSQETGIVVWTDWPEEGQNTTSAWNEASTYYDYYETRVDDASVCFSSSVQGITATFTSYWSRATEALHTNNYVRYENSLVCEYSYGGEHPEEWNGVAHTQSVVWIDRANDAFDYPSVAVGNGTYAGDGIVVTSAFSGSFEAATTETNVSFSWSSSASCTNGTGDLSGNRTDHYKTGFKAYTPAAPLTVVDWSFTYTE